MRGPLAPRRDAADVARELVQPADGPLVGVKVVIDARPLLARPHDARPLEHLQVVRHRGPREAGELGDLDRAQARPLDLEHRADDVLARLVAEGTEHLPALLELGLDPLDVLRGGCHVPLPSDRVPAHLLTRMSRWTAPHGTPPARRAPHP